MMSKLLLLISLLLLCSCGGDVAGGTSSSENAKIMGQTLLEIHDRGEKKILEYVKIEVRLDDAIPGSNAVVYETFSNDFGLYEVSVPQGGSYTLYAYQDSLAVVQAKLTVTEESLVYNPILDTLSFMKMYLPHDSLSSGETLYFQGTDIVRRAQLQGSDNGYQVVLVDNVPQGLFAGIGIFNSAVESIAGEVQFTPDSDTGTMVVDITDSKPLWRFSLAVGVKQEVLTHFGGESDMLDSLREKYGRISSMFDMPFFKGRFLFSVDSLYSFNGSYLDNIVPVDPGYDYNIYYTDEEVRGLKRTSYLYFGSPTNSFFKEWDRNLAAKLLAEARGALDRRLLVVDSITEPFESSGYIPEASLLYDEMASQEFATYDIACMNHNGSKTGGEVKINSTAVPSSIVLLATKNDVVLHEAVVKVYRSELGSGVVDTLPYLTGKTDFTGRFTIHGDAYRDNVKNVKYGNLLVHVVHENRETSLWLPLDEVGEIWFHNQNVYYKKIEL